MKTANDLQRRFWSKVAPWGASLCWEWTAARDPHGYGRYWQDGGMRLAHRVSYQLLIGAIPDGASLDHLCRNTSCVNPDHLEPVSHVENVRRGRSGARMREKTECPRGHPYSGENLRIGKRRGERYCRECHREWGRRERIENPEHVRERARRNARKRAEKASSAALAA